MRLVVSILLCCLWAISLPALSQRPAPPEMECDSVMAKTFARTAAAPLATQNHTTAIYLKHRMQTHRNGQWVRYVPGMLRLEPGDHDYFTEAHLKQQYHSTGLVDAKMLAYSTTARYQTQNRFLTADPLKLHLFYTRLFPSGPLNPFHPRNKGYYRYAFMHFTQVGESSTVRIAFKPRWNNNQLASGYADIDPTDGTIRAASINFYNQFQTFSANIRCTAAEGKSDLPATMRLVSKFRFNGNRVDEVSELTYSYPTATAPLQADTLATSTHDITAQCLVRVDTARALRDNVLYFDSLRPAPLRTEEANLLAQHSKSGRPSADTLARAGDVAPIYRLSANVRWTDELFSSHTLRWGSSGRSTVKLPPLLTPSMVEWSGKKGVSVRTRFHFGFNVLSNAGEPNLSIDPRLAYSFKQKQVYWELPLHLRFWPRLDGSFRLKWGGGAHSYNNRQAKALLQHLENFEAYDSLVKAIEGYLFHDYRDAYTRADFSVSPVPGLTFTVGGRHHLRSLIDRKAAAAQPYLLRNLASVAPHFEVSITPGAYYYREHTGRRVPLYSHWPTLVLSYERGYSVGRGQTHYERLEADARYRLDLYAMRSLFLRCGAGAFTRRGIDCFLDYDYFRYSFMPQGWSDEWAGEYQLLSSRWYNESRYYVRATATYESPLLLLGRLGFTSRYVQTERLYLNLLSVHKLPLYTELGYGATTHLFDFGTFLSIAPDRSLGFGFKMAFRLFE